VVEEKNIMQNPIDPARLLGRHSEVQTRSGTYQGTILAAGARGVSIAVGNRVLRVAPADVLAISPR
jgi:hypothetical protein